MLTNNIPRAIQETLFAYFFFKDSTVEKHKSCISTIDTGNTQNQNLEEIILNF